MPVLSPMPQQVTFVQLFNIGNDKEQSRASETIYICTLPKLKLMAAVIGASYSITFANGFRITRDILLV